MMHGGLCPGGARVGRPKRGQDQSRPDPRSLLRLRRWPLPRHEYRRAAGPGDGSQGLPLVTYPPGQRLRGLGDNERSRASRANGLHQPVTGGQSTAVDHHARHDGAQGLGLGAAAGFRVG